MLQETLRNKYEMVIGLEVHCQMKESRLKGSRVDIDYQDTLNFFNGRGNGKPLKHKYNYVLFQDDNPELAVERDLYEKKKILSQLSFV